MSRQSENAKKKLIEKSSAGWRKNAKLRRLASLQSERLRGRD